MNLVTNHRRYYQDAYTTTFSATVVEQISSGDRVAVRLEHTYFYPTSGGQPADHGQIGSVPVEDVFIREADGAIFHTLARNVPVGEPLPAEIDWPRRFDHMQQHTGQHILSQAFVRVAEAATIGFHLSDNNVTIDLDTAVLTPAQITAAEALANQIVWENRPIQIRFVTLAEAQTLPLRKIPESDNDQLRLIDITDFDLTACGGTHVGATGGVGLIKIIRAEKRGDKTRIEFCCGQRALQDYEQKQQIVSALTAEFTTGAPLLVDAIQRLRADNKQAQRALKKAHMQRQNLEIERLLAASTAVGHLNIITHVFTPEDDLDIKSLAAQLAQREGVIALLGLAGPKTQLVFARADGLPGHMQQLLQLAWQTLGGGGGGGSAAFAQGGGPAATAAQVEQVLTTAKTAVMDALIPGTPSS